MVMPALALSDVTTHDVLLRVASVIRRDTLPEPLIVAARGSREPGDSPNALIKVDAAHIDRWLRSLAATGRETSHHHTTRGTIARTVVGTLDGLPVRVVWDEPGGCRECGGGAA